MRYFFCSLLLCLLAFSAVWAYRVNYQTRDVIRNLKSLQVEIARQEEKFIMLQGEWAYLNRPERLSDLSERFFSHLGLMPISAQNFANVEALRINATENLYSFDDLDGLDNAEITSGETE